MDGTSSDKKTFASYKKEFILSNKVSKYRSMSSVNRLAINSKNLEGIKKPLLRYLGDQQCQSNILIEKHALDTNAEKQLSYPVADV
jgi:hypothetical protein